MKRAFDLKAALSGEPIQYRDLCTCYFLYTDKKGDGNTTLWFSRIGEASDHIETNLDGDVLNVRDGGETRVHMAPRKVKKTVWVNLYWNGGMEMGKCGVHDSEVAAKAAVAPTAEGITRLLATAVPVEIEVSE